MIMKVEVWLENNDITYDTVKSWLSEFNPEEKHIDDEQIQFYIYLDKIEDVFEVSNLIGEDIEVGSFCDMPLIKIV